MKPARLVRIYRSRLMRRRCYELLDDGASRAAGVLLHRLLIALVIASVTTVVLGTTPSLSRYAVFFDAVEYLAVAVFSMEYGLRLWCATEHPPWRDLPPARARLAYVASPAALIDLVSILPFYLQFAVSDDLKIFILLRLLRFFKLARYSPVMRTLIDAVYGERRSLLGCLYILVSLALVSASAMYIAEREAQPDKLGSIPDALYWAVVTLTTVGYGDVTPVTAAGKAIAAAAALCGIVMLALPVGLIATAFTQAIQRRDFVVTWSMVAHVPLFSKLGAADVAELMRFLQSQTIEAGELIVRRGEIAHSMYFIATGEVEIDLVERRLCLGPGKFFGEAAIIRQARRSANVRATIATRLLVLEAGDLRSLMERRPEIARLIREEAVEQLAVDDLHESGDLTPGEIAER